LKKQHSRISAHAEVVVFLFRHVPAIKRLKEVMEDLAAYFLQAEGLVQDESYNDISLFRDKIVLILSDLLEHSPSTQSLHITCPS